MSVIRFSFAIEGRLRFLSHLDLQKMFNMAIQRAALPIAYSQGFNPHPQLALGPAHAVGVASVAEYADMELIKDFSPEGFLKTLQPALPQGIRLLSARALTEKTPALMASINCAVYVVKVNGLEKTILEAKVAELLAQTELLWQRKSPKGIKTVDLRPGIFEMKVLAANSLFLELRIGNTGNIKPDEVIRALNIENLAIEIIERTGLYIRDEQGNKREP